jgi:hypothetical protein
VRPDPFYISLVNDRMCFGIEELHIDYRENNSGRILRSEVAPSERGGDHLVFWHPGDEAEFAHMPRARKRSILEGYVRE